MGTQKFDFFFSKKFEIEFDLYFDLCWRAEIIQVGLNMHLYDDIGDASSTLWGLTSSFQCYVAILSYVTSKWCELCLQKPFLPLPQSWHVRAECVWHCCQHQSGRQGSGQGRYLWCAPKQPTAFKLHGPTHCELLSLCREGSGLQDTKWKWDEIGKLKEENSVRIHGEERGGKDEDDLQCRGRGQFSKWREICYILTIWRGFVPYPPWQAPLDMWDSCGWESVG